MGKDDWFKRKNTATHIFKWKQDWINCSIHQSRPGSFTFKNIVLNFSPLKTMPIIPNLKKFLDRSYESFCAHNFI